MNKSFFLTNDNYIGYVSLHILVNVTGHNLPSAVINLVSFERKKSRPIAQLWATSILLIVLMHLSLSPSTAITCGQVGTKLMVIPSSFLPSFPPLYCAYFSAPAIDRFFSLSLALLTRRRKPRLRLSYSLAHFRSERKRRFVCPRNNTTPKAVKRERGESNNK